MKERVFILATLLASQAGAQTVSASRQSIADRSLQSHRMAAESHAIAPESKAGASSYIEDLPGVTWDAFASPVASAVARPLHNPIVWNSNTAAINAALATGAVLSLRNCDRVEIGSSLIVSTNRGGIVGDPSDKCGKPSIYMPAAAFTNATNLLAARYAIHSVGVSIRGQVGGAPYTPVEGARLANVKIQSEVADNRNIIGVALVNTVHALVDNVEIAGLPLGSGITVQSSVAPHLRNLYVHDFYTNTIAPALIANAPNTTGIELGGDSVGGIGNTGIRITNPRIADIETGPAFQAANGGDQSDGINCASSADTGLQVNGADIRRTAEPIDNFCSHGIFTNIHIEDAYNFGVKLVHGAQYNLFRNVTMLRVGLAGIVMGATSADPLPVKGNILRNIVVDGVNAHGRWSAHDSAVVLITGTPMQTAYDNVVDGLVGRLGAGKYGWLDTDYGSKNIGKNVQFHMGAKSSDAVNIRNDSGYVQFVGSDAQVQKIGNSPRTR